MKSLIMLAMMVQVSPNSIPKQKLMTSSGDQVKCKLAWEGESRVPTRICRTMSEWDKIAAENQKDFHEARRPRAACQLSQGC